ncbi:MAG: ATP-binding cassette domain-containing protein, partial [Pseudomonadota bacterium]
GGVVVEQGPTAQVFEAPREAYTKMLLAAEPSGRKAPSAEPDRVVLEGRNIRVVFPTVTGSWWAREKGYFTAVDGVDLALRPGQTIGVVGESGSGKTTLGRALLRLQDCKGQIRFDGRDLAALDRTAMRPLRKELQLVFQDPFGSLSPRLTAGQIVTEGLLVHEPSLNRRQRDQRAVEAFAEVQLDPAWRNRYPHEFSGGQRQRIAIARAMILKPKVVVLDEPTSALDRSVQKQIVELLRELQASHDLSYIFISHDLAVVRALSDYIVVMKDGRVVEEGETDCVFAAPQNGYTQRLLAAAFGEG